MKLKSFAKINLTLDVLKKSGDYHLIQTIFQQVNLHDQLTFKKNLKTKNVVLKCSDSALPVDERNSIIKAANLLKIYAKQKLRSKNFCGIHIYLEKNIPIASGLGGASSNAAMTLIALNKIWNLNLSKKTLEKLGAKIGKDVPFFLYGGTALGTHFGEKIKTLAVLPKQYIIIAINGNKESTKKQYGMLEKIEKKSPGTIGLEKNLTRKLAELIKKNKPVRTVNLAEPEFSKFFHNDFELINKPKICHLQKILLRSGAACVHICGSGPAVFAFYKNRSQQQKAYRHLKYKNFKNLFII